MGPATNCGKKAMNNVEFKIWVLRELGRPEEVGWGGLDLKESMTRLIPWKVKKEIPIGRGTRIRNSPMEEEGLKKVLPKSGLYLKKMSIRRLAATPETAKSTLKFFLACTTE